MATVTERNSPTYDLTGLSKDEMLVIVTLVGQLDSDDEVSASLWSAVEDVFGMDDLPVVLTKEPGRDAFEVGQLFLHWS